MLLQADTTSTAYQIGYQIGSWLPVLLLSAIFIWLLLRALQRNKSQ